MTIGAWVAASGSALGLAGWILAQRRLERAVTALDEASVRLLGDRVVRFERLAVVGVVVGVALYVLLGRGPDALAPTVAVLVANASALAAVRWRGASALPAPGAYRAAAVLHAASSALVFVGAALYLLWR